jgi:hypothetical protein
MSHCCHSYDMCVLIHATWWLVGGFVVVVICWILILYRRKLHIKIVMEVERKAVYVFCGMSQGHSACISLEFVLWCHQSSCSVDFYAWPLQMWAVGTGKCWYKWESHLFLNINKSIIVFYGCLQLKHRYGHLQWQWHRSNINDKWDSSKIGKNRGYLRQWNVKK